VGAKNLAEQMKLEVQQKLELIRVRQKGSAALEAEVKALQEFEKQLQKTSQEFISEQSQISAAIAGQQIRALRLSGGGFSTEAGLLQVQGVRSQAALVQSQIEQETERQEFLSGADLDESKAKVAELTLQGMKETSIEELLNLFWSCQLELKLRLKQSLDLPKEPRRSCPRRSLKESRFWFKMALAVSRMQLKILTRLWGSSLVNC
jgi:hypothetical protein